MSVSSFTTKSDKPAAAVPKDAAAIILVRAGTDADPEVFWARRAEKLAFMGGYHAFPGGQLDRGDREIEVADCDEVETAAMIACAARELLEETGILLARRGEALTRGQFASVRDDLTSGRMSFAEVLVHYGLELSAKDFTFVGRWVTPPFSPRRFDTWFFLVHCPAKQEPAVDGGELAIGEWIPAREAVARWERSEILCAPPVLHGLRTIAGGWTADVADRFLAMPQAHRNAVRRIEFRPGYICFPLRTPTKPPATHTNCYLIGGREVVVIDPASGEADEQAALAQCVDELQAEGRTIREIILSHVHPDHVGGVDALREHLGGKIPVAAHALTAEGLKGTVQVDRMIEDNEIIELPGHGYVPDIRLTALHTPGHARGHLCFYDEATGALLTGDNILGLGSVLIDPPEGNMRDYLNSLQRMKALPKLTVLFCAHGPALGAPRPKIDEYIQHRLEREGNILVAVRSGLSTIPEIVTEVYTDIQPVAVPWAERATLAHLDKLVEDGAVTVSAEGKYTANVG
jgi:glyoxylase-like metal-dependent hydrolase (beta-lactamase superfamily II)/8-oxo-dGTP pyrophosphatase MutT (NUDIX family)